MRVVALRRLGSSGSTVGRHLRACSDARFSCEKRFSEKRFHTAFRALDITLPELAVTCHCSHPLKTTASSHLTHRKTKKKVKYSSRCYCSTPTGFIAAIHAISNVRPVRCGASSCHHHTLCHQLVTRRNTRSVSLRTVSRARNAHPNRL